MLDFQINPYSIHRTNKIYITGRYKLFPSLKEYMAKKCTVEELNLVEVHGFDPVNTHKIDDELVIKCQIQGKLLLHWLYKLSMILAKKVCVCHKLIQVQSWLSDVLQQQLTLPNVNKFGGSLSRCHLCIGNNDIESMI